MEVTRISQGEIIDMIKSLPKDIIGGIIFVFVVVLVFGVTFLKNLKKTLYWIVIFEGLMLAFISAGYYIKNWYEEKEYRRHIREIEINKPIVKLQEKIEVLKTEQKETEVELRKIEFIEKTFSERVRRFFEVIDRRGFKTLEEIEKKIISSQKLIVIVSESGESLLTPEDHKKIKTAFQKFLKEKELELVSDTLFGVFVKYKISRTFEKVEKLFPIKIPGTSSFVIVLHPKEKKGFAKRLISKYKEFVNDIMGEFSRSKYYEALSEEDKEKVTKWLEEFNPPLRPKILISIPYQSTLFGILHLVDNEGEVLESLKQDIIRVLKQRIAIANLKIAYLFESVGYKNEIVEK